jgi:hypothetical protein
MDKGQESYLSNPTSNPTSGVVEITRLNRLASIYVNFVRPDDAKINLIQRISAETAAKISRSLATPC